MSTMDAESQIEIDLTSDPPAVPLSAAVKEATTSAPSSAPVKAAATSSPSSASSGPVKPPTSDGLKPDTKQSGNGDVKNPFQEAFDEAFKRYCTKVKAANDPKGQKSGERKRFIRRGLPPFTLNWRGVTFPFTTSFVREALWQHPKLPDMPRLTKEQEESLEEVLDFRSDMMNWAAEHVHYGAKLENDREFFRFLVGRERKYPSDDSEEDENDGEGEDGEGEDEDDDESAEDAGLEERAKKKAEDQVKEKAKKGKGVKRPLDLSGPEKESDAAGATVSGNGESTTATDATKPEPKEPADSVKLRSPSAKSRSPKKQKT